MDENTYLLLSKAVEAASCSKDFVFYRRVNDGDDMAEYLICSGNVEEIKAILARESGDITVKE